MNFFVTAIGTDCGKTLASAILCEALHADYWKPVQAGSPHDSDVVKSLLSNPTSRIHKERYCLGTPASPHAAAKIDGVSISLNDFTLPDSNNHLIVEGAGGALVPLNDSDVVIDLAAQWKMPVIVVSNFYLGSINHTLLTIEALRHRKLNIAGIIFNGARNVDSESIILQKTQVKKLLVLPHTSNVSREFVKSFGAEIKKSLT
jgi:dethiobiotin synthetase